MVRCRTRSMELPAFSSATLSACRVHSLCRVMSPSSRLPSARVGIWVETSMPPKPATSEEMESASGSGRNVRSWFAMGISCLRWYGGDYADYLSRMLREVEHFCRAGCLIDCVRAGYALRPGNPHGTGAGCSPGSFPVPTLARQAPWPHLSAQWRPPTYECQRSEE